MPSYIVADPCREKGSGQMPILGLCQRNVSALVYKFKHYINCRRIMAHEWHMVVVLKIARGGLYSYDRTLYALFATVT